MANNKLKEQLDILDRVVSSLRLIESNKSTQLTSQYSLEAGIIIMSLFDDETAKDIIGRNLPEIEAPTQETFISFVDAIQEDIKAIEKNLRNMAIVDSADIENLVEVVALTEASLCFTKAKAFFSAYLSEVKQNKALFDDFEAFSKVAKNVVILINEDMNQKLATHSIKAVMAQMGNDKKFYFHNEWQPMVNGIVGEASENVYYESLHCEDCIKKFDLAETIFYSVGFKKGEKLPVEIKEEAFLVMV